MGLKDIYSKLKELAAVVPAKTRVLKPTVKKAAFMLILFAILSVIVMMLSESYCVRCETGRCECVTTSIIGLGILADLAAAALAAYLIINIMALLLKI